jgi:small subunit ribosomal protein S5
VAEHRENREHSEIIDKLVAINRTAKVVKGGRRFAFTALVVVGDGNGNVGFGKGKAKEVADAKKKALEAAKRAMIRIPLREGRTLHHDVLGRDGAGKVILRTAPSGTGVIAGGPMRAIFEALGVKDVVAKSTGTSNPFNMVLATFDALKNIQSPKNTALRLGKKVGDVVSRRETQGKAASEGISSEDDSAPKKPRQPAVSKPKTNNNSKPQKQPRPQKPKGKRGDEGDSTEENKE